MRQFLIVRLSDNSILGTQLQEDPDDGPIIPQGDCPIEGAMLVRYEGEFSRKGRNETEVPYWIDGAAKWIETATLEQARANAWSAAKAARDAAESADFEFDGVLYQPDIAKITGAVLAALLPRAAGDPFSINWTVSDNSVVTLDAAQVMALGLTLTARINAIHHHGRILRALIDNAATPAEAYGHTWESLNVE